MNQRERGGYNSKQREDTRGTNQRERGGGEKDNKMKKPKQKQIKRYITGGGYM